MGIMTAAASEPPPARDPDVTTGRTWQIAGENVRGPWERFAWLFGTVWIVFMMFPIGSAWGSSASQPARVASVTVLVVYSAVYIATYTWMIRSPEWHIAARRGALGLVVMVVLMAASAILTGPGSLGAGAFLISIAMFAGPAASAFALAGTAFIVQCVVLAIVLSNYPRGFESFGVLFIPLAIVFVTVGCIRLITSAQERHDEIEKQVTLVAERERVARDVHDVLGHSLTVVTVKAELAERLVDLDPQRAKEEIAQVRSLAREALAEVRATVSGLRVARLADELESARTALEGAGIVAEIPDAADTVDPRHRIVVAWVLREAITNVIRHSRAARCTVALDAHGIVVEDDGVGTPTAVAEKGLRGIRERVDAAGARLLVDSAGDGRGTRVEVRW